MIENDNNNRTGLEIAVIGMAGRFPGAGNLDLFWENLKIGVESISFFSNEELKESGIDENILKKDNYIRARSVLEDIEYFDSAFFGYTPREAAVLDPQVRICLECAWHALEDAGYNPDLYDGSIGLYMGASGNLFWEAQSLLSGRDNFSEQFDKAQLSNKDYLSLRIAYDLNLKGPAIAVYTTCSTSLVAIDAACKGLLMGQCSMALAGGVTISLPYKRGYIYEEGMVTSPDGHVKAFDAAANGTNGGDGIGIVVLKSLEEAIEDGDNINTVIKGSAVNNDGNRKVGFTAPSVEGQAEVIRAALHMAEVEAESIGYIEAHGTGTRLGDPIEIEALIKAFDTPKTGFCRIGAVKTNVGHLDSAAGIAGFIKTVLVLKNRLIPPSLNFTIPNPRIDFQNSPFRVNTKLSKWEKRDYPLRAGISSFGIGGTNAHIVLEEAPDRSREPVSKSRDYQLFLLSAKTETALNRITAKLLDHLKTNPGSGLPDTAYTLQVGRKAFKCRRMMICTGIGEAIDTLSTPCSGKLHSYCVQEKSPPVIFMFSGQGAQYVNMGSDLYRQESAFREEMERCFDMVRELKGWDMKEMLYPAGSEQEARKILYRQDVTQPLMFIFEYCLARLLMKWGIHPVAMIGYSIGEYVAACLANVFSLEHALSLAIYRGSLMNRLPEGSMVSVPLPEEELKPLLNDDLEIAVDNGTSCIVSGTHEAVEIFISRMKEKRFICIPLDISHAGHSRMMDPMLEAFREKVRLVSLNKPQIPYISNVTGTWITVEQAMDPAYWARQVRATVRFSDGLKKMLDRENGIFIELGPGRNLITTLMQHEERKPAHLIMNLVRLPQQKISDHYYFLDKIGRLWLYGQDIDWEKFYRDEKRYRVSLPTYCFEQETFNIDIFLTERLKEGRLVSPVAPQPSLDKKSDVSDWFYVSSWKISPLPLYQPPQGGGEGDKRWLVLSDHGGFGTALAEQLQYARQEVVVVRTGPEFSRAGEWEFSMDMAEEAHYRRLWKTLHDLGRSPHRIIHFWSIGHRGRNDTDTEWLEKCQETGFYSLLYLARTLGDQKNPGCIQLTVVTSNMQGALSCRREAVYPEKATLLGVVEAIPREYPDIRCRTVDFAIDEREERGIQPHIEQLLAELAAEQEEPLVAYRGRYRQVPDYEPVRLEAVENSGHGTIPRLRGKGVYLITGGLGGIGLVLAEFLARHVQARLILTGRTPFPSREQWEHSLDQPGIPGNLRAKIEKLMEIEKLGAEVLLFQADVTDKERMLEVVNHVRRTTGSVNGIIHAAGVAGGALIHQLEKPTIDEIFAPKLRGTLVLDEIFRDSHLDFFVLCSSLGAVLGGMGEAAYCGANSFLDAFAHSRNFTGGIFTSSINWDTWQEVGGAVEVVRQLAGSLGQFPGHAPSSEVDHPLLDRLINDGQDRKVFISLLSPASHWVLDEHRIEGKATIPGTAYLEMARAAAAYVDSGSTNGSEAVELRDVYLFQPLMVEDNEKKEVRTILTKNRDGHDFVVVSQNGPGNNGRQWRKHAAGTIFPMREASPVKHEIKTIEAVCSRQSRKSENRQCREGEGRVIFGSRWQRTIQQRKIGAGQALTRVELPGEFAPETGDYGMHPALLDCAIGIPTQVEGAFLPFAYKKISICGALPPKVFSLMKYGTENRSADQRSLCFDVTLMDETGTQLLAIEEYTLLAAGDVPSLEIHETGLNGHDPGDLKNLEEHYLKHGILNEEGIEVFTRLLAYGLPRVIVSTRDLKSVIRQTRRFDLSSQGEGWGDITPVGRRHPRPPLSTPCVPPRNEIEQIIAATWGKVLGYEGIGIHDDFFELGGNSVKAVIVTADLHKKLNVRIAVSEVFGRPTIGGLAGFIKNLDRSQFQAIEPNEKKSYYEASSAQKRLYIWQQMNPDSTGYNLPTASMIEGRLDEGRLQNSIKQLIRRHSILRTSLQMVMGEPVQKVHDEVEFELESIHPAPVGRKQKCSRDSGEGYIKEFIRPFDLSEAPLLRASIIKIEEEKYLLLVDIHHIAADAFSLNIIMKELVVAYTGEILPPLKLQYTDFSEWQNRLFESDTIDGQRRYWLERFQDEVPILTLPADNIRPSAKRFTGDRVLFEIDSQQAKEIRQVLVETETTLYVFLLAVFGILLGKYSLRDDIVVGTTIMGRSHTDLHGLIGMFVNMLALRIQSEESRTFGEFLEGTKKVALEAYDNQDYQFEHLVSSLELQAEPARNPMFDVVFAMQNVESSELKIKGLRFSPYSFDHPISKFDLRLSAVETSDKILMDLEYSTELFNRSTAEEMARHYRDITRQVLENRETKLKEIRVSHNLLAAKPAMIENEFNL